MELAPLRFAIWIYGMMGLKKETESKMIFSACNSHYSSIPYR